jgi:hypothetical protein
MNIINNIIANKKSSTSACINTDVFSGFPYQKTLTDEEFCRTFEINNVTDFKPADWYYIKYASSGGYYLQNVKWVGHDLYQGEEYGPEDVALLVISWGNNSETLTVRENNNSYYAVYSRVE